MGTEQSTQNHQYAHSYTQPDPYAKTYSLSPAHHTSSHHSDLRHIHSFGNISAQSRPGISSVGPPSKPLKTDKTIFIEADNGKRVRITFQISEEDNLTCGWLVSETIRQFADKKLQEPYPNRPIVALQTMDDIISLDYWLSDLERSVSILRDGIVLKPFYGNNEYIVRDQKINLQFFYLLKVIGTGGFSKVYLARRKDNGQFYAIKMISKKEMLKKDKEENVFNERNIMTRLHHPFLVQLCFAFQTPDKLFLVMEFCPGGELFYHLSQRQRLREDEAKVYMGEIILALNYLHKNNIIYRDLKPENILLDIDGHLRLADFGLCKVTRSKDDLNYTFCGSPEYMAPEVIKKSGYNFSADFYTLGTLIYEMVVGRPPFNANRNKELFDKILHQDVTFPPHISSNLKMFISQLLNKNPKERLGSKHGLAEIVNHPWCSDLDFVKIAQKQIRAPIVPDIFKTNFAREFIDAKISCIEDGLGNFVDAPPSRIHSVLGEGISEIDNPAMYRKFANFSFYSNIDDPYEKFQDSIFGSNGNTPDGSPRGGHTNTNLENILTSDVVRGFPDKPAISKKEPRSPYGLKNAKEDYTEDINERSPHMQGLAQYAKLETKFLGNQERSMTPRFQSQTFSTEVDQYYDDRKSLPIYRQDPLKSKKSPLSYNGLSQNSLQMVPEQPYSKNKGLMGNPSNTLRLPELDFGGRNADEVSEEILSRNDKPFMHIDSSRTVYRESQLAHLTGQMSLDVRRNGPKLSGLNKTQTYSYVNYDEGVEDPTRDGKNSTAKFVTRPSVKIFSNERNKLK